MRKQIPPKALLGLPLYLVSRARNQVGWLFRRQQDWVRTPRPEDHANGPPDAESGGSPPSTTPAAQNQTPSDLAAARS
jgi:hypothetical protein